MVEKRGVVMKEVVGLTEAEALYEQLVARDIITIESIPQASDYAV
jgi:hypothetical protein